MKKNMLIMLICVGILFGGIFLYKFIGGLMFKKFMQENQSPAVTVSAMKIGYSSWHPLVKASGSSRAIRGVDVTTELAGLVKTIYFTPGTSVDEGTVLVQLNADADNAQLRALEATANLAEITYNRDKAQYEANAISKAILDTDEGNLKNSKALAEQQAATVLKKTIRAPFTGRLGISQVNPGQYLNPGDKIVTLQQLDPIYVDFFVPQQTLTQLKMNQPVQVSIDTFPDKIFSGKITTINPIADSTTRNVEIEATLENPNHDLVPGLYGVVEVRTGEPQQYLTLPLTALSFNPYGDIVFIVKEDGKDKKGKPLLKVTQTFVKTGETRGDQISILEGLKEGDMVVTSGQMKLRNGSTVIINNTVAPLNNPAPNITNE
ncbi:MAG: efflux RND transporter periplasmic adaptor subunit [Proteobacteria bacterium]|nr:efflux RND transporter periplasmic adaptor subunit [Pseudomonadota bacterium]